jgi:hypothetical protein
LQALFGPLDEIASAIPDRTRRDAHETGASTSNPPVLQCACRVPDEISRGTFVYQPIKIVRIVDELRCTVLKLHRLASCTMMVRTSSMDDSLAFKNSA